MLTTVAKLLHGIDKLSENAGKLLDLLVLPIIVLEAGETILRYVFKKPTDWSWLAAMLFGAFS